MMLTCMIDTHDFNFDWLGAVVPDIHGEAVLEGLITGAKVWEHEGYVDWPSVGLEYEVIQVVLARSAVLDTV